MSKSDFLGRGWKFPVSLEKFKDTQKLSSSEADDSIRESIMIILGTSRGERVMNPDFGCNIQDLVFSLNNTSTATLAIQYAEDALKKWEPRIELINVDADSDSENQSKMNIFIEYKIITSNTKYNLVYPFYLERAGEQ